jgi:hypothetical protein
MMEDEFEGIWKEAAMLYSTSTPDVYLSQDSRFPVNIRNEDLLTTTLKCHLCTKLLGEAKIIFCSPWSGLK